MLIIILILYCQTKASKLLSKPLMPPENKSTLQLTNLLWL